MNEKQKRWWLFVLKTLLASAVAVVIIMLLLKTEGAHAAEGTWHYRTIVPFAASREAAMQARISVFKDLEMPEEVQKAFLEKTKEPGEKAQARMGESFTSYVVKGVVYHDVVIDVTTAGDAEVWRVAVLGDLFTLYLIRLVGTHYNWGIKRVTRNTVTAYAPPTNAARAAI